MTDPDAGSSALCRISSLAPSAPYGLQMAQSAEMCRVYAETMSCGNAEGLNRCTPIRGFGLSSEAAISCFRAALAACGARHGKCQMASLTCGQWRIGCHCGR